MLKLKQILFGLLLILNLGIKAQDLIYLNSGSKFEALVKEITETSIKYKNINNPEGPTYVIAKTDVLFIEYKNGNVDVINRNPAPVSPKSTTPSAGESKETKLTKPSDVYYMNKNSFMINGLALTNADITLMYERDLLQNHLGVMVLGSYNFNTRTTWPNLYLMDLANTKKNYDIGLGLNFYPSVRKKSQYFVGVLVKYMNFSFDREITVQEEIGGFIFEKIEIQKAQGYQLATMIVNGFQVRITPTFTYKAFVGIGPFTGDADLMKTELAQTGLPKMYLGLCFGYRF